MEVNKMKFVQALFSLKYEPRQKIRRFANDIEDFLSEHYGPPQTIPIPDEFSPDAPRMILYSKNGHSQISFSQISVDFLVNFDGDFTQNFEKTKLYISQRLAIIVNLLEKIEIKTYCFCGITYNVRLDIDEQKPIDYIKQFLNTDITTENLYDASQHTAIIKDNKYFINQQIGIYREYRSKIGSIPALFDLAGNIIISEGIALSLDINNRYQYIQKGVSAATSDLANELACIFSLMEDNLKKWR